MSYSENIKNLENCIKPPSKGGPPIGELKEIAAKMGIISKGLKKAEICAEIEKILMSSPVDPEEKLSPIPKAIKVKKIKIHKIPKREMRDIELPKITIVRKVLPPPIIKQLLSISPEKKSLDLVKHVAPKSVIGKIRIGQKAKRGVKGSRNASAPEFINVDVTSGSKKKIGDEMANSLSPMKLGPVIDKQGRIANIFENYWQYSKLWKTAGHILQNTECTPTPVWENFRKSGFGSMKGKRRPLPVKSFGYATCSIYNDKAYDYLESRKEIYVPVYRDLIKDLPVIKELRKMLEQGKNIMIIDGDGPPSNLYPEGMELTADNWKKMINDPKYPFGHGYVVAGLLSNLL